MYLAGDFHPASYDSDDIDLSSLIYELDGGAAIHSLQEAKSTSLPSVTNIRDGCHTLTLRPSSGKLLPTMHTMFGAKQAGNGLNGSLPRSSSSCIGEAKLLLITLVAFEGLVLHLATWSESAPFVSCSKSRRPLGLCASWARNICRVGCMDLIWDSKISRFRSNNVDPQII